MKEIWKDIKGYEGLYQVSNKGNVKSLDKLINQRIIKGKLLKPTDNGNGYLIIGLIKNGTRKNYYIHRLVAEEFLSNVNNKKYVNHINFDKYDNSVENLEWCSQKENVNWSIKNMCHRKNITHSNTNEKYISYRKSNNSYRVTIDKKEYKSCKSLEEAIILRNNILNKEVV